ncbi:MAG: tryptophan synthase subunit alpha [Dehalococcoidia bacterium]|nr:tryptophan synthase subunit alpha [Dehalococcoidia bacterium]
MTPVKAERQEGRIERRFAELKAEGRTGLIAYLTVGFPSVEATLQLVPAVVEAGADMIELGVPFSDPLADGATVQRASQAALAQKVTLETCLQVCARLRQRLPLVPLLLMGYYNPILALGVERFAQKAREAGADGVIVPDLPPEEAGPLLAACRSHGLRVIFLLAPTSTDERMEQVGRVASGFIYCVSLTGVTGARTALPADLSSFLSRVRRRSPLPLAVGFGVSSAEHVRTIGKHAEAAIVGSALLNAIEQAGQGQAEQAAQASIAAMAAGAQTTRSS